MHIGKKARDAEAPGIIGLHINIISNARGGLVMQATCVHIVVLDGKPTAQTVAAAFNRQC